MPESCRQDAEQMGSHRRRYVDPVPILTLYMMAIRGAMAIHHS